MRTIPLGTLILASFAWTPMAARAQENSEPLTPLPAHAQGSAQPEAVAGGAQESAEQQEIDKLSGQIQDMESAQQLQDQRMTALKKQIVDLQAKLNDPAKSGFASADDLKNLADQMQAIDRKRESDNRQILKELEKVEKALGAAPGKNGAPVISGGPDNAGAPATGPENQTGYYYQVQSGNTLSAIAKAYTEQGHKVTVAQILAANPGLNPKNLIVGRKIFIPAK